MMMSLASASGTLVLAVATTVTSSLQRQLFAANLPRRSGSEIG